MVVFWFLEHVNSLSCNWYEHTANNLERSLFSGSNDKIKISENTSNLKQVLLISSVAMKVRAKQNIKQIRRKKAKQQLEMK